ncbi:MAG: hypothetical protein WD342_14595, partial [Verrucomicrobiales bacterium]
MGFDQSIEGGFQTLLFETNPLSSRTRMPLAPGLGQALGRSEIVFSAFDRFRTHAEEAGSRPHAAPADLVCLRRHVGAPFA